MIMAVEEDLQMHLLHLPATVLVAVLDCLGDAGAVVQTATACKGLWHVANNAHFNKIHAIRFHCYHPELQHLIPRLVQQFPNIQRLSLNSCSALPEPWLQPMCSWPVQQLDVANTWHWNGIHSACLLSWAPTLTNLTADGSSLPIAAAAARDASATTGRAAVTASITNPPVASGNSHSSSMASTSLDATLPAHQQQQLLPDPGMRAASPSAIHTPSKQEPPLEQQQQQQQQQWRRNVLQWPAWTGQLQQLQLRRLLVDNPVRCRTHGSSECSCPDDTLLSQLLAFNPHLTALDLSQNPMFPDRLLNWALTSNSTALQTLNLSGCELLKPGYVATCCAALRDLDMSGTDAGDADVALVASGLGQLSRLNLNGCRKVTDVGISALASSPAVLSGQLVHLNIGCLTRTTAPAVTQLIAALAKANRCTVPLYGTAMDSSKHLSDSLEGASAGLYGGSADSSSAPPCEEISREGSALCYSKSSSRCRITPVLLHLGLSRTSGMSDAVLEAVLAAAAAAAAGDSKFSTTTAAAAADEDGDDGKCDDLHLADTFLESLQLLDITAAQNVAVAVGTAVVQPPCPRVPRVGLCGLELAGCNNISGFVLQQLARLGVLSGLEVLDLSDVEALRQPSGSWNVGANVVAVARRPAAAAAAGETALVMQQELVSGNAAGSASAAEAAGHDHTPLQFDPRTPPAAPAEGHNAAVIPMTKAAAAAVPAVPQSVLGWLFAYSGNVLASLTLNGCYIDDATAAFIGLRCTQLQQLSLVGCRGLQSGGLRDLLQGCSSSLKSLQVGGSYSRWRESESLLGVRGLTEFRLLRRSSVRDAELAPVLAANSGLKSLALVGCYSCTDQLFVLAMKCDAVPSRAQHASSIDDAATDSNMCWQQQQQQQQPALQHLTELVLTACDGITGSSIARLRGLRHLRVSYCASFSIAAVQQIVLSCTKLASLELPTQLQRQLSMRGTTPRALNGSMYETMASSSQGRGPLQLGAVNSRSSSSAAARGFSQQVKPAVPGSGPTRANASGTGWSAGARDKNDLQVAAGGVGLPQQGSGGHLHGLKVVGI